MERLALVEVLHDRLRQVRPHHPCESHFREGRELLGHSRVRILAFIFELQRRPDALDSDRGARPRGGGPCISELFFSVATIGPKVTYKVLLAYTYKV